MDPHEIEDTSDWLGSPTRLETVKHYASMLEEDIQDLNRQLQTAKDNISTLVEMNDQLKAELQKNRTWMANLEAETTEQLAEIQSLSMVRDQNDKLRRELEAANGGIGVEVTIRSGPQFQVGNRKHSGLNRPDRKM
ncbi:hypothetical protein [Pseudomonas sp. DP16D-R1]|uniref:hypothetical protein n=1 Tax=Pseudomonas sp. DP16D-R1 TaxID=2075551 RepID=UPI0021144F5F|nr:hypothetical protein [Pseudomonas sp. DP16D-R1]